MLYLPISNVKVGMKIARSITTEQGQVLLGEGSILTEGLIKSLYNRNISHIYIQTDANIEVEKENIVEPETQKRFTESYRNIVTSTKINNIREMAQKSANLQNSLQAIVKEVLEKSDAMLNSLEEIDKTDAEYAHSINTTILSIGLGANAGLEPTELISVGYGAMFSDIGMSLIDEQIRNKKGRLSHSEYEVIKSHCRKGADLVRKNLVLPLSTYQVILDHHERWDGSGYPEGRKGANISKYARIVMIADVYDALIHPAPYRDAYTPDEAMEYIMGGSGILFDPKFAQIFISKIAPYPVGASVELSDGSLGIVCSTKNNKKRPIIKIYYKNSKLLNTIETIDLNDPKHLNITVSRMIGLVSV